MMWNARLMIFLPQITKKTLPASREESTTFSKMGHQQVAASAPKDIWEIKVSFSE